MGRRYGLIAVILVSLAAAGCSPGDRYAVSELRPGMCFDDSTLTESSDATVTTVPCDGLHDNEVVALLPVEVGGASPQEVCNAIVIDSPEPVEFFAITGVKNGSERNPAIACAAFRSDFEPLDRSLGPVSSTS